MDGGMDGDGKSRPVSGFDPRTLRPVASRCTVCALPTAKQMMTVMFSGLGREVYKNSSGSLHNYCILNSLTPELNPSAQRCLTRFFTGDFAS
jgi:hypothetical protein